MTNAADTFDYSAIGINDSGMTIGNVGIESPGAGISGVNWNAQGTTATIQGADYPQKINNAGVIIGDEGGNGEQAIRWDAGATFATKLTGPLNSNPAGPTQAIGLNQAGVAVGTYNVHQTVLWNPDTSIAIPLANLSGLPGTARPISMTMA